MAYLSDQSRGVCKNVPCDSRCLLSHTKVFKVIGARNRLTQCLLLSSNVRILLKLIRACYRQAQHQFIYCLLWNVSQKPMTRREKHLEVCRARRLIGNLQCANRARKDGFSWVQRVVFGVPGSQYFWTHYSSFPSADSLRHGDSNTVAPCHATHPVVYRITTMVMRRPRPSRPKPGAGGQAVTNLKWHVKARDNVGQSQFANERRSPSFPCHCTGRRSLGTDKGLACDFVAWQEQPKLLNSHNICSNQVGNTTQRMKPSC